MLSRILSASDEEVQPLNWRNHRRPQPQAVSGVEPGDTTADAAQLRARVAELTAALETQTRLAYDAGARAAETAIREKAAAEVRATVEKLAATAAEIAGTRAETIRRAEADTVRLAIEIARRILHRELSMDPSALEALVKAALVKLQSQEVYRVRVHPAQEALVRQCLEQMGRSQFIEVVNDPVQPPGGAVFEVSRGTLDASVETQLAEIEHGLIDKLEGR
jgi:flagellar assembly protein FliH